MKSLYGLILVSLNAFAIDSNLSGIVDVRAVQAEGIDSYTNGGLGKFRFNPSSHVVLSQIGLSAEIEWTDMLSTKVIANGYWDGTKNGIGITEAFLKYTGLPSANGYRISAKSGVFYPKVTIENTATAWVSPYSLNFSSINSWVAEEVRHIGVGLSLDRLGRFHQSDFDLNFTLEGFVNNDPTGAMLAWHGWTVGSRQTLWHETLKTPNIPAMEKGGALSGQADYSDPFLNLDDRIGLHLSSEISWRGKGKATLGYYDNNADTSVVKQGQYSWRTRFAHFGIKWSLPYKIELLSQIMVGDTLMKAPTGEDAVNNDFHSANLLLSKKWKRHRFSARAELFKVIDNDATIGDDNNEHGHSFTVSYRYHLNKSVFLYAEYDWVQSHRPARKYITAPINLTEKEWQFAMRYFF